MIEILYIIFTCLFGLAIGSFLNVVIYRLPLRMNLSYPPSHCPVCNARLKWYHNIPIFSYLFLGGKCAFCKAPISPRYMIVELLNMILWLLCYLKFELSIFTILAMIFCSALICVFYIDFEHMIIPDSINILIAILGVIACIFCSNSIGAMWYDRLIGGIGMFVLTLALSFGFKAILKKEALGGGDIKLLTACGLLLGWKLSLFSLFLASLLATIFVAILLIRKKMTKETQVPFGPFLSISFVFSLFLGNPLLYWYFNLFEI
ncbi:MAG: prepilin peptidase [Clostridia bacterium]